MAEVIVHLGAHGTDNGAIAAWLERNAARLARKGTLAMASRRFLQRLSQSLADLGDPPSEDERRAFCDALGLGGHVKRLAVSAPSLLGSPAEAIGPEGFYAGDSTERLAALGSLLPRDVSLTLALAVAPPGLVVPALLAAQEPAADAAMIEERIGWLQGDTLPWAGLVRRIRQGLPRARIVVWRHENMHHVWPEVLARFAGHGEDDEKSLPLHAAEVFAMQGINEEGQRRMRLYLESKPPPSAALMQRVATAFAQGYGRQPAGAGNGAGLALSGPVRDRLAQLDEGYAAQWWAIARIDAVEALG